MRLVFLFSLFFLIVKVNLAQNPDSVFIKNIYDEELKNGHSYDDLKYLCKKIGARISGSQQANNAVLYTKEIMEKYGFDTVYLQKVMVPNWKRGNKEQLIIHDHNPDTRVKSPNSSYYASITALGGSTGTNGKLEGDVVLVNSFEELHALGKEKIKDKIVFFNMKMEPTHIRTFKSYGGCVVQRVAGADEASKLGAKGVMIRSVTHSKDNFPHTGSVKYNDSVPRIPAVAISTIDADKLERSFKLNHEISVMLQLNCEWKPDTISYNVIGEIKGIEKPEQIIAVGGHLDSWDIGEGAHDDGAGCIHAIESIRLLKQINYKPKHTLRVIMFMNEENGLRGGKEYAKIADQNNEKHIAAIESDAGGLVPRGFSTEKAEHVVFLKSFTHLFKPYDVHYFEQGGSGADVGQIRNYDNNTILIGFIPDSQRYFDYHHSASDVFENVHKRELELGCATISSLIYLIDKYATEPNH